MPVVKFLPQEKSVFVEPGITILQAARMVRVTIESPCNGAEICGKCKVKLADGHLDNIKVAGKHQVSPEELKSGMVLACGAQVQGDITVILEDLKANNESLKVLSHGESVEVQVDSFITKKFSTQEQITSVYAGKTLIGTETGDTVKQNYGIVVDIGTTTLVTSLVDLNTGKELNSESSLNPQSIHAQDVLSRINFSSEENGLEIMYRAITDEINEMIKKIINRTGVRSQNIYEVIYSGNTCMLHLATNVSPQSMGRYPYTPAVTGGCHVKAIDHGLEISPFGIVYLPPIISAYVGADITSGILASNLSRREETTLFVDIGTNGEMVLKHDSGMSATSTAAGPAFEGMNITYGMRAGSGAVEYFEIDSDGSVIIKTIGNTEPVGICGSGLLDIVGELVASGVITKNGRFVSREEEGLPLKLKERLVEREGKTVFEVANNVYLTQKDIRQVQLAKGAIRAGIEFLLQSRGVPAEGVERVLIAGSFGYHLRAKSLINIGLLPREFAEKIEFIGNTSKSGGKAFLINRGCRESLEHEVKDIYVLDLASFQDFDRVFVKCLNF